MPNFKPHPKNPDILIGNTYRLKKQADDQIWEDKRTRKEIEADIARRAKTEEQKKLDREIEKIVKGAEKKQVIYYSWHDPRSREEILEEINQKNTGLLSA